MRVVIAASVAALIAASPAAAALAAVLRTSRALRCLVYARPHMTLSLQAARVIELIQQSSTRVRTYFHFFLTFQHLGPSSMATVYTLTLFVVLFQVH